MGTFGCQPRPRKYNSEGVRLHMASLISLLLPAGTEQRDSFSPANSWDSEANPSNAPLCKTAVTSLCCSPSTQMQAETELEGRLSQLPARKGFLIKLQPLLVSAFGSCFLYLPFKAAHQDSLQCSVSLACH